MNTLTRFLPGLVKSDADAAEISDEDAAKKTAAERREFHRTKVRNGPVSWKTPTAGQERRFIKRTQEAQVRKTNKRHRRQWLRRQASTAVLRGQLQAAGALPYATEGFKPTLAARYAALQWIVGNFGERYAKDTSDASGFHVAGELVVRPDMVEHALKAALEAYHSGATTAALRKLA